MVPVAVMTNGTAAPLYRPLLLL